MVPTEGVEPTHSHEYQILSLARLPIPPHRQPIKSMLSAVSPRSFLPLYPVISIMHYCRDKQPGPRKREKHLSNNGKWRSFPNCRICSNRISTKTALGKSKLTASRFGRV